LDRINKPQRSGDILNLCTKLQLRPMEPPNSQPTTTQSIMNIKPTGILMGESTDGGAALDSEYIRNRMDKWLDDMLQDELDR